MAAAREMRLQAEAAAAEAEPRAAMELAAAVAAAAAFDEASRLTERAAEEPRSLPMRGAAIPPAAGMSPEDATMSSAFREDPALGVAASSDAFVARRISAEGPVNPLAATAALLGVIGLSSFLLVLTK